MDDPSIHLGFIAYEYAITFDQEVELFWKEKLTIASALFLANRYVALIYNVLNVLLPDPTTYEVGVLHALHRIGG